MKRAPVISLLSDSEGEDNHQIPVQSLLPTIRKFRPNSFDYQSLSNCGNQLVTLSPKEGLVLTSHKSTPWLIRFEGQLIYRFCIPPGPSPKIAAFDMDGTLIRSVPKKEMKSGKCQGWQWLYPTIPAKLRELVQNGYNIVIFTNQASILGGGLGNEQSFQTQTAFKDTAKKIVTKIDSMIAELQVPVSVFISTTYGRFRKPSRGMFDFMLDLIYSQQIRDSKTVAQKVPPLNVKPNPNSSNCDQYRTTSIIDIGSFLCGDAAGRHGNGTTIPADHSSADFTFAVNCFGYAPPALYQMQTALGQLFYTPESFFLQQCSNFVFNHSPSFTNPFEIKPPPEKQMLTQMDNHTIQHLFENSSNKPDLVILVGAPASGKTVLAHNLKKELEKRNRLVIWVNRDTLGTMAECLKLVEAELQQSTNRGVAKTIIIDNTNPTIDSRKQFIHLGHTYQAVISCIIVETTRKKSLHLNMVRANHEKIAPIPTVAIHSFLENYQKPTLREGFSSKQVRHITIPLIDTFYHAPMHREYGGKYTRSIQTKMRERLAPTWEIPTTIPVSAPIKIPSGSRVHNRILKQIEGESLFVLINSADDAIGPITSSRCLQDHYYQYYDPSTHFTSGPHIAEE